MLSVTVSSAPESKPWVSARVRVTLASPPTPDEDMSRFCAETVDGDIGVVERPPAATLSSANRQKERRAGGLAESDPVTPGHGCREEAPAAADVHTARASGLRRGHHRTSNPRLVAFRFEISLYLNILCFPNTIREKTVTEDRNCDPTATATAGAEGSSDKSPGHGVERGRSAGVGRPRLGALSRPWQKDTG